MQPATQYYSEHDESFAIPLTQLLPDKDPASFIEVDQYQSLFSAIGSLFWTNNYEKKIKAEIFVSHYQIETPNPYNSKGARPGDHGYRPSTFEDGIRFSFDVVEKNKKEKMHIDIKQQELIAALNNPRVLEDGRLGVGVSERILFNSTLASNNPLTFTLNLFFGNGYGRREVNMIFSANKTLDSIRVVEKYHGEKVLFTAHHLQPKESFIVEQQLIQAQRSKEEHERNEAKRFDF